MANFKYTAISSSGEEIDGVINAHDKNDAIIQLKADHAAVTSIKEVDEMPSFMAKMFSAKVKEKDLALVSEQFAIILKAGLPILKTIQLVANQVEEKNMKKLLSEVYEDVKGGSTLAKAFEDRGDELPATFIETIRAGEESGKLDVAFERMTTYLNKKVETNNKVITALTYPVFVIIVAIAVIIIIMVFAVPTFTSSFAEMGQDLPLATRILINVSDFFSKWIWLIILLGLVFAIIFLIWKKGDKGHYEWDRIKLRIPILGRLNIMNAASEYSNTLATMLGSGLPAVKALSTTGKTLSNFYIGQDILTSCADVENGNTIASSLRNNTELPELAVEMTAIGEESGALEHNLSAIAEYYDREVLNETNRAISLLEPIIICILAVIVFVILLAVYLPMFSLYGSAF